MTLARRRLFGVSTAVVTWLAITSLVWAQSAPPNVTATLTCGCGAGSTVIEITSWSGTTPSELQVTIPDSDPEVVQVDPNTYAATEWNEEYTDAEGWVHGTVTTAGAGGGNLVYNMKHRAVDSDHEEFQFYRVGDDPSQAAYVVASFPDGSYPPAVIIVIIIIIIIILGCIAGQNLAIKTCNTTASSVCGGGEHVQNAHFSGYCGMGSCSVTCK